MLNHFSWTIKNIVPEKIGKKRDVLENIKQKCLAGKQNQKNEI